MTFDERAAAAHKFIDDTYDQMLYDGMDPERAVMIQEKRQADHEELQQWIMAQALSGWKKPR